MEEKEKKEEKLIIERDFEVGDSLLYCSGKRIYLDDLRQKMSWQDWGKEGMGLSYQLLADYCADGNVWHVYIDGDLWATWDDTDVARLVQKYGRKFNQAKRTAEIAARKTTEEEFGKSVEGEKVEVDYVNGEYLLRYGSRQIFAKTLKYNRMIQPDYIAADIDPNEQWTRDTINYYNSGFAKLVQKYGVANAYSAYPC